METTPDVITIREMELRDAAAVISLWQAAGLIRPWNDPEQDIAFAFESANSEILLAECGNCVVAACLVGHGGHRGWVYYVAVAPEYRGKGFGRKIVQAAESWLVERGIWKLNLLVREDNRSVLSFYGHLGFKNTATVCFQKKIGTHNDVADNL